MLESNRYTVEEMHGTLIGNDPYGDNFILVHPLWSEQHVDSLMQKIRGEYKPLSVFGITKFKT